MKRPGLFGLLILSIWLAGFTAAGQVWLEDFTAEANGATSGTASGTIGGSWSVTYPSGGSFFRLDAGAPYGPIFLIDNTVTEGVWRSNSINISALGDVAIEATIGGLNASGADYVRAYYKVDGGPEILFAQVTGAAGLVSFTAASAIVNGSTLQIVIRGKDTAGGAMGFDNVSVTDISVLYSIANAAWNNGNTWSTVGFGGGTCSCIPDADSRVIIGNGRTVTFSVDGTAAGVEIQSTGRLQWTNTGLDLAMARGGVLNVQSGGVLTRNGQTNSSISFGNYTYSLNIAGTVDIGLFNFGASSNSSVVNSGTLSLSSATGLTMASGVGYSITNTGTFNLSGMNLNNADLTIDNSGTINQSGNFVNIDNGSAFNNLATGIWNWSLTPNIAFDGTVTSILDCTAPGNIFNYDGAGPQRIIPVSYHHLTLSTSGAKDANNASFSVAGNWLVSGTASFTEGTGTVTLDGSSAQTITNPAGETFNNLTINNSSAVSPQITLNDQVTVSTVLTMLDGNVDLNGNTLIVSSSAAGSLVHNLSAAAGWMYGGSLRRSFTTTTITVGNVAGLFPLGDASDFRPFFIGKTNPPNSNGTMTITYTPATTATDISFTDNTIPPSASTVTIQRRHDSFWTITKTGMTTGSYNIRAGGTGFTLGAAGDLRLTRAADATGIGTATASSIAGGDVRVNRAGLAANQLPNSFYVASLDATNSPLPVTLLYFDARLEGDEVVTAWKTAQEKDNDFFTVQKTTDFETFYDVGSVPGQGTTREEHVYSFTDISPFTGKSYYRLRQTDFDGAFTYSKPVFINYEGLTSPMLKAYPNPFNGEQLTVEIKGLKDIGAVPVQIFDAQGHKVMDFVMEDNGPGIFKEEITFPSVLSPGLYIIRAGKTMQMIRKIFVTK